MLADPQTSGGLLLSIRPDRKREFEGFMRTRDLNLKPIGELKEGSSEQAITIV